MAPGLQGTDDCEHLTVVDLIVAFSVVHRLGVESNRVPFAVLPLLTQDRTRSEARCVDFDTGVAVRIIDSQDRAFSEATFKLVKGRLLLFSPLPWCLAREAIQGFADSAEVLNELSIEVRKTAELLYI